MTGWQPMPWSLVRILIAHHNCGFQELLGGHSSTQTQLLWGWREITTKRISEQAGIKKMNTSLDSMYGCQRIRGNRCKAFVVHVSCSSGGLNSLSLQTLCNIKPFQPSKLQSKVSGQLFCNPLVKFHYFYSFHFRNRVHQRNWKCIKLLVAVSHRQCRK